MAPLIDPAERTRDPIGMSENSRVRTYRSPWQNTSQPSRCSLIPVTTRAWLSAAPAGASERVDGFRHLRGDAVGEAFERALQQGGDRSQQRAVEADLGPVGDFAA